MNAEQFIVAFIKSEILMPKQLKFQGNNYYYNLLKPSFENIKKKKLIIKYHLQFKTVFQLLEFIKMVFFI